MPSNAPAASERVLSTLNEDGSRRWINPVLSKGRFLSRRRAVAYLLIAVFTLIPYLRVNGAPLVLLDIVAREFTFFGTTFYATDTLLLALLMLTIFLTIFLATALFGRVWCGWACPQTVYLEFVYRPLQRFFLGAPGHRAKPGGWRRPAMYGAYLLISMFLAHTFLAYFVGVDQLVEWVQRSPFKHPTSFLTMAIVTAMMMFDFAFFREQTCIVACPYGRMQSVLLDRSSIIVAYDEKRGEPRGKKRRKPRAQPVDLTMGVTDVEEPPLGDCIDCMKCVATCSTGIDIRDGLQMECVNCAQCIDACDDVMKKIGRDPGLIRYGSQESIQDGKRHVLRPRVILYPILLLGVASLFTFLLVTKAPADVSVVRGRGMPFAVVDETHVASQVTVKIRNRSQETMRYTISVAEHPEAEIRAEHNPVVIEPGESVSQPISIIVPRTIFVNGVRDVLIRVTDETGFESDSDFRLIGPANGGANDG